MTVAHPFQGSLFPFGGVGSSSARTCQQEGVHRDCPPPPMRRREASSHAGQEKQPGCRCRKSSSGHSREGFLLLVLPETGGGGGRTTRPGGQELSMNSCREVPAAAWQQLVDGATWPKLTKVSFSWRLGGQLWGSGGAEVLCRLGCKKPPVLDVLMPRRSSAEGASAASPKASRLRLGSSPSSAAAPS